MVSKLKTLYADSLFRNSFYLMLTSAVMAVFGFFFWLICARIYNPEQVGLATSLISAGSLVSVFSMLGFNNVIVRFLPASTRKNQQLSTAFILTSIASLVVAAIFLAWAYLSQYPSVQSSHTPLLVLTFTVFVLTFTVNAILESAFIAYRSANYVFLKNVILSALKFLFLFIIIGMGFVSIVEGITLATLVGAVLGFYWLARKFAYRLTLSIDKETIDETKHFAIGNYFGTLFGVLPSMTLVLIVVQRLGAQSAAFFYIPSMIIALLNVIPSSVAQSLFAEVSHEEGQLETHFKSSLKHMFSLLIPSVLGICLLGGYVLHFFGPAYAAAGTAPLIILAFAGLINAANALGDTLLNIKKMPGLYLFMNILNAVAVVVPAYIFAPYGLTAIAWSVLFGQLVTAIVYVIMNWRLILDLRQLSA